MGPDCTNPAFPRAIPHGTVIIDYLTKVVFFGPSWETISDLIWEPFRTSFGDHFGPHFGPKIDPRRLDLKLGNFNSQ